MRAAGGVPGRDPCIDVAKGPALASRVLAILLRAIFGDYRKRARARGCGVDGDARCGAVTFVQRFGDALNRWMLRACALRPSPAKPSPPDVHFHVVVRTAPSCATSTEWSASRRCARLGDDEMEAHLESSSAA